jgi:spore protease
MDEQKITDLIHSVLPEELGDFVVTPKEIDSLVDTVSNTIAAALNMSLHPDLDWEEVLTLNPNK